MIPAAFVAAVFFSLGASVVGAAETLPVIDPDDACTASLPSAAQWYGALASGENAGHRIVVAVDLDASPGLSAGDGEFRYRMAFNNIAEGWSWQPGVDPAVEDYYRWKFLPLQSVGEERGSYEQEEKIGERQKTGVVWRYDYFLAFDNPYAFYPRVADDDAGFAVPLPRDVGGVRMVAVGTLESPVTSESTTFWKAIYARPVDFTLKKRYLVVRLDEVQACDAASGRTLARIRPKAAGDAQR